MLTRSRRTTARRAPRAAELRGELGEVGGHRREPVRRPSRGGSIDDPVSAPALLGGRRSPLREEGEHGGTLVRAALRLQAAEPLEAGAELLAVGALVPNRGPPAA